MPVNRSPYSPARRAQPRPLLVLWLVPFLWSLAGSSFHNPGACAGDRYCKLGSAGPGCEGHSGAAKAALPPGGGLYCVPSEAPGDGQDGEEQGHSQADRHKHPDGHDHPDAHHHPDNMAALSAPVAVSGDGCYECQWISASALSLSSSIRIHLLLREVETAVSSVCSLVSTPVPSPFSRGPPPVLTFLS